MRIDSYLHFNGNCTEAFRFYQQLMNGAGLFLMTWGESPMCNDIEAARHAEVMHGHLMIGQSHLMGTDAGPMYATPQGFRVCYDATSVEDAERVFAGLAEGGSVFMPIAETFWANRFGMLTDRFGIPWMVNQAKPTPPEFATDGRSQP